MMPGRCRCGSDGLILPFAVANFCKHVEITDILKALRSTRD
jgi:hypothetical protein